MSVIENIDFAVLARLTSSIVVLAVVLIVHAITRNAINRHVSKRVLKRRWTTTVRNGLFLVLALALVSIWAQTLQTVVVSAVAIAVALVIATKELIECVVASLFRGISDSYSIGDRVAIGPHYGDVIDQNLLTTTLLEVSRDASPAVHTGRVAVIPNSLILSTAVVSDTEAGRFVVHGFSVPRKLDDRWQEAHRVLQTAARKVTENYRARVKAKWQALAEERHVKLSPPDSDVAIRLTDNDALRFEVRIPCPVGRQAELQDAIVREYLDWCAPQGDSVADAEAARAAG